MTDHIKTYGLKSTSEAVSKFVKHIMRSNEKFEKAGKKKTPVCIWGMHGIGKTEIVSQIADQLGHQFTYIAPAQFEEMGDLLGMPKIEAESTVFVPPSWVPKEEGPGILLIDDVNRSDDRILRGIMQLLQNFELVSWKLPKGWQIILTANPEGGDYSVTPMDDAMLTRMMHITMTFDVKEWAVWAEQAQIDPRGINFVLTYPEISAGQLTTPRSLVQFFNSIELIEDLEEEIGLVQALASSCLDEETVSAFITFVQQNLTKLIEPKTILNTKNFDRNVKAAIEDVVKKEVLRVDILATLATRLSNYVIHQQPELTEDHIHNIQNFIKLDVIPNDIRLSLIQDFMQSENAQLSLILADPELNLLLLENM